VETGGTTAGDLHVGMNGVGLANEGGKNWDGIGRGSTTTDCERRQATNNNRSTRERRVSPKKMQVMTKQAEAGNIQSGVGMNK
jgi:hypothetical protein